MLCAVVLAGCASGPPHFPQAVPVWINPRQFCSHDSVAEKPSYYGGEIAPGMAAWNFVRVGDEDGTKSAMYMHIRDREVEEIQRVCGHYEHSNERRLGRDRRGPK